jgi:hypothetical protein
MMTIHRSVSPNDALLAVLKRELQPITDRLAITLEKVTEPLNTSYEDHPKDQIDRYWVPWNESIGAWMSLDGLNLHVLLHQGAEGLDPGELTLGFTSVLTGMSLNLQNQVAIHANAVSLEGKAIAFAGYSGRGKSTLSAYCASRSAGFVTDDVLIVDPGNLVLPGNLRIKLYPSTGESLGLDAAEETRYKIFYEPTKLGALMHQHPVPLVAIYLLEESTNDEISTQQLDKTDAAFALMTHGYNVGRVLNRNRTLFEAYVRLVETVPVRYFYYPRAFDRLPDVYDFILKDVQP